MKHKWREDQWERLFEQKKRELLENDCRQALEINNLDDLQVALQGAARDYKQGTFPDFINFLNPSLVHIKSFTTAISSCTQYTPVATLVWGVIQAVIESTCQSSYPVDDMLGVVADLNESLPELSHYSSLFSNSLRLQTCLQDIYDTYMDYCISSIQYVRRSSTVNFLLYFVSSSPQQQLKKTKILLKDQFKEFRRVARLEQDKSQHRQIQSALRTDPLSVTASDTYLNEDEPVEFPVSTVTLYRNYTFLGRDGVLQEMREFFETAKAKSTQPSQPRSQVRSNEISCFVIHGLGGIGKTQTALEFTHRFRDDYEAIFWIRADSELALSSSFVAIAEALHLAGDGTHDGQSQGRIIKDVASWFRTTEKSWLLVFDNVEDLADIEAYLPRGISVPADVILTTQKQDFFGLTERFKSHKLENLTREEGAKLMFKYLQRDPIHDEEEEFACKISDLIGGLPLALATIGAYLNQTGSLVSAYYNNLKTSSRAWESSAIGPARQYEKTLESVFDFALSELPKPARALINMLAFLSPDYIPEDIFLSSIGCKELSFLSSEADFIEMIRILRKRQLIRRDTSSRVPFISIHRTVQWSVLLDLSKDMDERWVYFRKAFDLVRRALPEVSPIDNPEPDSWAQFEKHTPQVLNLRSHCLWPEPPVELPEDFAQVMSDMATYMWHAGLFNDGKDALETAEHILDDQNIGDKNPLRGNIHEHIGIIVSFNGVSERDEAMERRRKAIKARIASLQDIPKNQMTREDEIRRFNVESDMAFGLMQGENFDECEEVIEKCHEQYKKWGNEDEIPFEYLKYNHIISYVRMSHGQPVEAIECAKKGARLGEHCAGSTHPMTQLVRFTLSNHLYLAGELKEALKEAQSVLAARSKVCGEFNHFTLESYSFVGSLLAKSGKFSEAEKMFLKCLDRRKWTAWNEEGVARAQYLYAQVLEQLGQVTQAEDLFARARKTRDRFLKLYPQWLTPDEQDELVVFDQMVSIWAGRYTGKLKQH